MKKNHQGFTLIELLVTIAIIGILASIILVSLNGAQAKSRDSKRLIDAKSLQLTLERYYDVNNSYPNTGGGWWGGTDCNSTGFGNHPSSGPTGWIPNLAPIYIQILPSDPKPATNQCYLYRSDGKDYMILVYGTVEGTVPNEYKRQYAPDQQDYAIYSPGAAMW